MSLSELGRLYWTNADFNSFYAGHYVMMSQRLTPGEVNLVQWWRVNNLTILGQ